MTRTAIRVVAGVLLAAFSGLLLTLAFTPYDLWPLIFVGFVPAVVAQHRIMPKQLSGLAYGVGLGAFFWGYFGPMFAGTVWFMEWLPLFVGVLATLLSMGDRAFHERTGYGWFVLNGSIIWVGIEAIRGFIPQVGTGGFVAYALYSQPWFIQPVSIFSIYGLSLLIMAVNYAVALGIIGLIDRRRTLDVDYPSISTRLTRNWLAGTAVVLVAWAGLSLSLLGQASVPGSSLRVAVIQPDSSLNQDVHTRKLMDQTRQAAAQGAKLVIWPEGALSFDPQARQTDDFTALVQETGVYLVIGYGVRTYDGLRNEATVLAPDGRFLGVYGKDHPVTWLGETSISRGSFPVYDTPLGRIATIICYDLDFTDTARNMAAAGAQFIGAPSNDWPGLADRQYSFLVMRAVENRVSVAKADGRYDSVIIDPTGRILSSVISIQGMQTVRVADVPLGKADAPLIGLGDWVGWLSIAGIVFFVVLDQVTRRRARKTAVPGVKGAQLPKAPVGV